jgi:sorting nexin-9/18/33
MQTTAETMNLMAEIKQTHIADGCLPWQETIREHATPSTTYAPLVDMHTGTHKKLVEVFEKEQTMEVKKTNNKHPTSSYAACLR